MQRFFSSFIDIAGDKIIISDQAQLHYMRDVLRLKEKEEIILFDHSGLEYNCLVLEIQEKEICLKIKAKVMPKKDILQLTVACAIPKHAKFDDLVNKLVQLGVTRIVPLETERVVVKLDQKKKDSRRRRWEKIAISAAEQSHRNILTGIDDIKKFKQFLNEAKSFDLKIIPHLGGKRNCLKEILAKGPYRNILVLIGPEGDFSDEEIKLACDLGFIPVTLGDTVLRVDTAAIAAASFIRLYENG